MNSDRLSEDWMQTERKSDGGALTARFTNINSKNLNRGKEFLNLSHFKDYSDATPKNCLRVGPMINIGGSNKTLPPIIAIYTSSVRVITSPIPLLINNMNPLSVSRCLLSCLRQAHTLACFEIFFKTITYHQILLPAILYSVCQDSVSQVLSQVESRPGEK